MLTTASVEAYNRIWGAAPPVEYDGIPSGTTEEMQKIYFDEDEPPPGYGDTGGGSEAVPVTPGPNGDWENEMQKIYFD